MSNHMITNPSAAIQAKALSLHYGDTWALNDVTLAIPPGAVVGLVGSNGAGKSSLLNVLAGLSVASSGTSHVLGCSSVELDDATRARLGVVAQNNDLLRWLTVWQHVAYIGSFYPRWQVGYAHQLCQRLNLVESSLVSTLSVGDQQKLALVLALAHQPDVLLLDEPVASLDAMARREFMRLLFAPESSDTSGSGAGRTVLLSSHLLSDLQRVVSHVAFMRQGRIQLFGAWDELLEHVLRVPLTAALALPAASILTRDTETALIDTRQLSGNKAAATGFDEAQSLSLEDLFVALQTP